MATDSLSILVSEGNGILLDRQLGEHPAVSSLQLAEHFDIRHKNVLRDIRAILKKVPGQFGRLNFELMQESIVIGNGATRQTPCYLLTRDGFTLLVMGYNSPRAISWKIRYIEAFNAMESHLLGLAQEAAYVQGVEAGRLERPLQIEAARKEGVLEGMRMRRDNMTVAARALEFRRKGLSWRHVALLLGMSERSLRRLMERARALAAEVAA